MRFEMQIIEHTMLHKNAGFEYHLLPFMNVQYQQSLHHHKLQEVILEKNHVLVPTTSALPV